jgi:hypothetical protein
MKLYIEEIIKSSKKMTSLTFAPHTGRITIKYTDSESNDEKQAIGKILDRIKSGVVDLSEINLTIRGRLKYDSYKKCYAFYMVSNNKLEKLNLTEN